MIVNEALIRELTDLIRTVTAIPAPSNHEEKRRDFLLAYLHTHGFEEAFTDEADNVLIEWKTNSDDPVEVLYTAHTDTVFPDTDALPVREENGILYGPGVGDDTANLCAMILALRTLKETGFRPKRSLAFVCDSGEEGLGNLRGMRAAFERYRPALSYHVAIDGSTDHIVNRAVGSKRYRITIETKGGHSFNHYGNRNAIETACSVIEALYQIDPTRLKGKTTCNVGTIEGGTSVNTIAQKVVFLYEFRSDEQESLVLMQQKAQQMIRQALNLPDFLLKDGYTGRTGGLLEEDGQSASIRIDLIGDRPGMGPVDPQKQQALSTHLSDLLTAHTGVCPVYDSGSTDCNLPLAAGIPAICFGIYTGAGQHTREEWIDISSFKAGMETLFDLMEEELDPPVRNPESSD